MESIEYFQESSIGHKYMLKDSNNPAFEDFIHSPKSVERADVAIFGVPFALGSFKPVTAVDGPRGIRHGLSYYRTASVSHGEDIDLIRSGLLVADYGDLQIIPSSHEQTHHRIDYVLTRILRQKMIPIMLGGDHSITYPAVRTFAKHVGGNIGLIWMDCHLDTADSYNGDPYWCGCPLKRILDDIPGRPVRARNVVHLGAHGFHENLPQITNARKAGINILTAENILDQGIENSVKQTMDLAKSGTNAIYLTFDIDVTDAAFAPGTQGPCPGGLIPIQLLKIVRLLSETGIDAYDLVEVAPPLDVADLTVRLAGAIVIEFLVGLIKNRRTHKLMN
jgi:agmatinase